MIWITLYIIVGLLTVIWLYKEDKKVDIKNPLLFYIMCILLWPAVILALIEI